MSMYLIGYHPYSCRRCNPIDVERFNFYDMHSWWMVITIVGRDY